MVCRGGFGLSGRRSPLVQYRVLKELPQGQQPGDLIDVHEDVGAALVLVGAAEAVTDEEPVVDEPKAKRRYLRRDLQAET